MATNLSVILKHKPYFLGSDPIAVMVGGAGSGKSYTTAQKHIIRCISEKERIRHRILVLRKVGATITNSTYELCKQIISDLGLTALFKENKTERTLTYLNGNQLIFAGLDDAEKIKSITGITSIWLEEATEFTFADFMQLRLRLRDEVATYKQITLTLNPIDSNHWIKRELVDKMGEGVVVHKSTFVDNPHLPKEYREVMHSIANQSDYHRKVYYEGEWAVPSGLVFEHYQTFDTYDVASAKWHAIGLDFGFVNDPTACVLVARVGNALYVRELFVEKNLVNSEIAQRLTDLGYKNLYNVVCDSAEAKSIVELQMHGVPAWEAKKGAGSVISGIKKIKEFELFVHKDSKNLIKELNSYTWALDKDGNVRRNSLGQPVPVDYNNHCIDALRYGISAYLDILEI